MRTSSVFPSSSDSPIRLISTEESSQRSRLCQYLSRLVYACHVTLYMCLVIRARHSWARQKLRGFVCGTCSLWHCAEWSNDLPSHKGCAAWHLRCRPRRLTHSSRRHRLCHPPLMSRVLTSNLQNKGQSGRNGLAQSPPRTLCLPSNENDDYWLDFPLLSLQSALECNSYIWEENGTQRNSREKSWYGCSISVSCILFITIRCDRNSRMLPRRVGAE